ncbi:DUF3343 domain-containing protein [Porphyromonas gulae]|uniref:DUF3343 domain-containing protein n=1 Tax=Porphyromonas gulae TaxID=111105 RepID=UPI00052B816C|nr:DUF3343 domain-containing protein [Porphyromonas gulae]KGN87495.1 hypothetical protein HQ46_09230 [Porphyromonas gulae]
MSYEADSRFFLFSTTRDFIRAMKAAEQTELTHRVIAVPTHLSAECGMCLHISSAQEELLETILKRISIPYTIGI